MKFFIDENVPEPVCGSLTALFLTHEFVSAFQDAKYQGIDDVPLFRLLSKRGFHAIITQDKNQLKNPKERRALFDCNLHWIGHNMNKETGLRSIALTSATISAGFQFVLDSWVDEPHVYRLTGVRSQISQRLKRSPVWNESLDLTA